MSREVPDRVNIVQVSPKRFDISPVNAGMPWKGSRVASLEKARARLEENGWRRDETVALEQWVYMRDEYPAEVWILGTIDGEQEGPQLVTVAGIIGDGMHVLLKKNWMRSTVVRRDGEARTWWRDRSSALLGYRKMLIERRAEDAKKLEAVDKELVTP